MILNFIQIFQFFSQTALYNNFNLKFSSLPFDNTFLFFEITMAIIPRLKLEIGGTEERQQAAGRQAAFSAARKRRYPVTGLLLFRCAPTHCHFSRSSTADAFVRSSFLAVSDLLFPRPSSRRPLHFQSSPLLMSGS